MRVLIVEDNEDLAVEFSEALRHEGFDTTICHSVAEGIDTFCKNLFHLVILDLHLKPKGLKDSASGLDFVYFIKERKRISTPIIVTTGLEIIKPEEILDQGVNAFFYKTNLDLNELVKTARILATNQERNL